MVYIYATLVKKGLKTLEEVPAELREDVRALLSDA